MINQGTVRDFLANKHPHCNAGMRLSAGAAPPAIKPCQRKRHHSNMQIQVQMCPVRRPPPKPFSFAREKYALKVCIILQENKPFPFFTTLYI